MTLPSGRARGFTLVELLVALLVSAIVIGGALSLMIFQQRSFQTTSADRNLQETARIALDHVASHLRQAGYGVDPALAFDFGVMPKVSMERAYGSATFAAASYDCGTAVTCRDSVSGPDELVFLARDPQFGPHPLLVAPVAGFSSLSAAAPTSTNWLTQLHKGQLLQVVCYDGDMTWAYVTVSGAATENSATHQTAIPVTRSATGAFPNQTAWIDPGTGDACYQTIGVLSSSAGYAVTAASLTSAAEVFKIDRYRYYVQFYNADGTTAAPYTSGARPYLMLDKGLTGVDPVVIAPDVEDIQFAYQFPLATANTLVGATEGAALSAAATSIELDPATTSAVATPVYSDASTAASRLTHHPGNIRAVRVSVVVRSPNPDPKYAGDPLPAAGNRPQLSRTDGYRRLLVETTVAVRNLAMELPMYPAYDATSLSMGGG